MNKIVYKTQIPNEQSNLLSLLRIEEYFSKKERVGFILPKFILRELNQVAPPRQKSQFVSRAIAKAIDEKRQSQKKHQLARAYRESAATSAQIAEDWHTLDLEDWNEN